MTLQDLFDRLLTERQVIVSGLSKTAAESLRIQLVKKWIKYKTELDALGFLADDLAACSMCRRTLVTDEGSYQFLLMPRIKHVNNYEVLPSLTTGLHHASI